MARHLNFICLPFYVNVSQAGGRQECRPPDEADWSKQFHIAMPKSIFGLFASG
jgi:hypothetical protein